MKKSKIIWLLVAAGLFLGGIIVATVGLSTVNFHIWELDSQDYIKQTYTTKLSADKLNEINVVAQNREVSIVPGDGDKIQITYYDSSKELYRISEEDGKLSVVQEDRRQWYDYIANFDFSRCDLQIQVPKKFTGDLHLESTNGKIGVGDLGKVGNVECYTTNDAISLGGLDITGDCTCTSSNGWVWIHSLTAQKNVRLTTSNEEVTIDDCVLKGTATCRTSNGEVIIDSLKVGALEAYTSNDGITLTNIVCEKSLDAHTSNDNIWVENIDAPDIVLVTDNDNITGTIAGKQADYAIISDATNGHNNLPPETNTGKKQLYVDTTNGNIDLKFAADES